MNNVNIHKDFIIWKTAIKYCRYTEKFIFTSSVLEGNRSIPKTVQGIYVEQKK